MPQPDINPMASLDWVITRQARTAIGDYLPADHRLGPAPIERLSQGEHRVGSAELTVDSGSIAFLDHRLGGLLVEAGPLYQRPCWDAAGPPALLSQPNLFPQPLSGQTRDLQ